MLPVVSAVTRYGPREFGRVHVSRAGISKSPWNLHESWPVRGDATMLIAMGTPK